MPVVEEVAPVNLNQPGRFISKNQQPMNSSSNKKQKNNRKGTKSTVLNLQKTLVSSSSASSSEPTTPEEDGNAGKVINRMTIQSPSAGWIYTYMKHSDDEIRNFSLMDSLKNDLGLDRLAKFKSLLVLFSKGGINVNDFIEDVKAIESLDFDKYFEQLLVSLPDIRKQNELFNQYKFEPTGDLYKCNRCYQVCSFFTIFHHFVVY